MLEQQMSGPSALEWPFPFWLVTSGCWLGQPGTGAFPVPRRAPGGEPAISRFFCLILASFLPGRGCQARTRGAKGAGSRLQSAEAARAHWLAVSQSRPRPGFREAGPGEPGGGGCAGGRCQRLLLTASSVRRPQPFSKVNGFRKGLIHTLPRRPRPILEFTEIKSRTTAGLI